MIRWITARIGIVIALLLFSDYAFAQLQFRTAGVGITSRLLLPVKQGRSWGYADTMKNIVIAPQFDAANPFIGKIAVVEKNKKAYAIDTTGRILTPGFDQLFPVNDTIFFIYLNEVSDTLGGWGVVHLNGAVIIPPAYDEVTTIGADIYAFRKDTLWGAVNMDGSLITEAKYDSITGFFSKYLLVKTGKFLGVMDKKGGLIVPVEFTRLFMPDQLLFAAYNNKVSAARPKGWGGLDLQGNVMIPFGFDSLFAVGKSFVGVEEHDTLGCYFPLANGNPTDLKYKTLVAIGRYWVELKSPKGLCGLNDTLGKTIVPVEYKEILIGGNGMWFVKNDKNLYGVYNSSGERIVEPRYNFIQPFRGNITLVSSGVMTGLINDQGEELVKPAVQRIIIRGNTVKIIRGDSSATFLQIDARGRIASTSNYDEFRVIRIGGREGNVDIGPDPTITRSSSVALSLRTDSLRWYLDDDAGLWGLRNSYTNDILIPPTYTSVTRAGNALTIVAIHELTPSLVVDGNTTYSVDRVGLVNDTTGRIVLQPKYANIDVDLGDRAFSGYVRATLTDGSMALVSTDGSERTMRCTWIEFAANGCARFCTGGKWTIEFPGEYICDVQHLCSGENLNPMRSFGTAATSKEYMKKFVSILGAKWGYVDSLGNVVITPQYDGAKAVQYKTGIVKSAKKWGMINMTSGANIIPCSFDALSYMETDSSTYLLAQNNGVRYGYIDAKGNIVIPADLKWSKSLGSGFIGFSRTGKWGVMNSSGQVVLDETYHEILPFCDGYAAVRKGNKWGYIDTTGQEVIALQFEKGGDFHEGLARVVVQHKWGYINTSGQRVVEAKFWQAGNFSGGAAPVKTRDGYGLISREGKWIMKATWPKITQLDSNLRGYFILRGDYNSGIARADGKIILYPRYEGYQYLGEGRISYRSATKLGIMDTNGRILTSTVFDQIKTYSEHFAAVSQGANWGYVNKEGKIAIEPQYLIAGKFIDHRAYVYTVTTVRASAFVDTTGKVIFRMPSRSNVLLGYSEGKYMLGEVDEKKEVKNMFFLTRHGVLLNRFTYKEAMLFENGVARVRPEGNLWGLVSYTGYNIVRPHFSLIAPFDHGLARFQMRYTQGLFTIDGKALLPAEYDAIYWDSDLNLIKYEKGGALGYLFEDGRICWEASE